MLDNVSVTLVDTAVFVIANVVNLLMVAIFLVRTRGKRQVERRLGWIQIALVVPLCVIVVFNFNAGREWWRVVLPLLLAAFLLVELLLDYILQLNFRETRLLGPYLLLYYAALMGMIGYTFMTNTLYGVITLITYFLQLLASWYSYRQVGHGAQVGPQT